MLNTKEINNIICNVNSYLLDNTFYIPIKIEWMYDYIEDRNQVYLELTYNNNWDCYIIDTGDNVLFESKKVTEYFISNFNKTKSNE